MLEVLRERLIGGFLAMLAVVAMGTFGYHALGGWPLEDCLYMTVITITTVGYGEVLTGLVQVPYARPFTIALIVLGIGVFLYFASTLTAFIIEGDLRRALQDTRMRNRLARLKNHIIVCGVGATGRHVVSQLMAAGTPLAAIDSDLGRLEELAREHGDAFLYVHGDATDDQVLEQARLDHAAGLVAALASDKDNLYLVVSARQKHPRRDEFRIVARGIEISVGAKLEKAGANSVVSPNFIGGMRMASEMIRPAVVEFMDMMLHDRADTLLGEISVEADSELAHRALGDLDLRQRAHVSILAVKDPSSKVYQYNPGANQILSPGMTLVALGTPTDLDRLRKMAK